MDTGHYSGSKSEDIRHRIMTIQKPHLNMDRVPTLLQLHFSRTFQGIFKDEIQIFQDINAFWIYRAEGAICIAIGHSHMQLWVLQAPSQVQGTALVGVHGAKPPEAMEISHFLIPLSSQKTSYHSPWSIFHTV